MLPFMISGRFPRFSQKRVRTRAYAESEQPGMLIGKVKIHLDGKRSVNQASGCGHAGAVDLYFETMAF